MPRSDTVAQRTQVRDEVLGHVHGLILAGKAAPGTLLRLAPIAESLDASITPVREALLLLAQDGWLAHEPNRGFRVLPIRRPDVIDTYLVHGFVAGELAARAATTITAASVAHLRDLDQEIRRLTEKRVSQDDRVQVDVLNSRLHTLIYTAADSPRLVWFRDVAMRFVPRKHWSIVPGWLELNRDEHTSIIDALAAGDQAAARDRMETHISHAGDLLIAHLDDIHFWEASAPDREHVEAIGLET